MRPEKRSRAPHDAGDGASPGEIARAWAVDTFVDIAVAIERDELLRAAGPNVTDLLAWRSRLRRRVPLLSQISE